MSVNVPGTVIVSTPFVKVELENVTGLGTPPVVLAENVTVTVAPGLPLGLLGDVTIKSAANAIGLKTNANSNNILKIVIFFTFKTPDVFVTMIDNYHFRVITNI